MSAHVPLFQVKRGLGWIHIWLVVALGGGLSPAAAAWERVWKPLAGAPDVTGRSAVPEAILTRWVGDSGGAPVLLLVTPEEVVLGQKLARVWSHSGFTVLLVTRARPVPTVAEIAGANPMPPTAPSAEALFYAEARLRAHPWAQPDARPCWLVLRDTLPEVLALAHAGGLAGRDVVVLDGSPRPATVAALDTATLGSDPAAAGVITVGEWWTPDWAAADEGLVAAMRALRAHGWNVRSYAAGASEESMDHTTRLARARIAADTLREHRAHARTANARAVHAKAPSEDLPTLHLTLRRGLALGCGLALALAFWAGMRAWAAWPVGWGRRCWLLLCGLLGAGSALLTLAQGLGPELSLPLAMRLGLASSSEWAEPALVAPHEARTVTLAESQDRQRLVRVVLRHWAGFMPTAPEDAAGWLSWVANPQVQRAPTLPPAVIPPAADVAAPVTGTVLLPTGWRRPLWDNVYPIANREPTPLLAVRQVTWHLRLQVRLAPTGAGAFTFDEAETWWDAWRRRQMTPAQFEYVLVAGLRAVGLPARLNADGRAEHHVGPDWQRVWTDAPDGAMQENLYAEAEGKTFMEAAMTGTDDFPEKGQRPRL